MRLPIPVILKGIVGPQPAPAAASPVQASDDRRYLIKSGKLLEVHCRDCRPARHLYIEVGSLDLPRGLPVPQIADHLVCTVCGAKNSDTYHPIGARPDARVGAVGHYPDFSKG